MHIAVRMLFGNRLALSVIADAMPPLPRGEAGRDRNFALKNEPRIISANKTKKYWKNC